MNPDRTEVWSGFFVPYYHRKCRMATHLVRGQNVYHFLQISIVRSRLNELGFQLRYLKLPYPMPTDPIASTLPRHSHPRIYL